MWKHNNISNELIFLGVTELGELLPPGLLALHRIMWKVVIIAMTRTEFENVQVNPKQIWNIVFRRLTVRVRGLYAEHTFAARNARLHNRTPPKPTTINKWLHPIAECANGGLHWHPDWVKLSYDYKVNLKSWEYTKGAQKDDPPAPPPQEDEQTGGPRRKTQVFVRGSVQEGSRSP